MKQSSRHAEKPLRQRNYHIDNELLGQDYVDIDETPSTYFEESVLDDDFKALFECGDSTNQQVDNANDFDQLPTPVVEHDAGSKASYVPRTSAASLLFARRNNNGLPWSALSNSELSSSGSQGREEYRREIHPHPVPPNPYNMHRRSVSLASSALTSVGLLPCPSSRHSSAPAQATGQSNFTPFGRLFNTSEDAKLHRHVKMRFDRHAYDENDDSVPEVEANRQENVERIYNAMTRGDLARDNTGSTAMKRWTREPHYPSDLVEAYAHKVFDCLLEQAREGFRGWHHNDYVADDRKGEDEDRDVNCAGRLENIITALELEKTICEDVMNSACQIRMFVNAPKAYSNRKHQNRVGNSKRPGARSNALSPNTRPSKSRKTGDRRSRARVVTSSDVANSTSRLSSIPDSSLEHICELPQPEAFPVPQTAPILRPLGNIVYDQYRANAVASTTTSPCEFLRPPPLPGIACESSNQQTPFVSPPSLSRDHFSVPTTPDDMKAPTMEYMHSWQQSRTLGEFPCPNTSGNCKSNEHLSSSALDWSNDVPIFTSCTPFAPAGLIESSSYLANEPEFGISASEIGQQPRQSNDVSHDVDLSAIWQD